MSEPVDSSQALFWKLPGLDVLKRRWSRLSVHPHPQNKFLVEVLCSTSCLIMGNLMPAIHGGYWSRGIFVSIHHGVPVNCNWWEHRRRNIGNHGDADGYRSSKIVFATHNNGGAQDMISVLAQGQWINCISFASSDTRIRLASALHWWRGHSMKQEIATVMERTDHADQDLGFRL